MKYFYYKLKVLSLISVIMLISINTLLSQSFSISDVNATKFPTVKASFVALGAGDKSYDDLKPEDFIVLDNGIDVAPSLGVECEMRQVDPEVSVVLILDKSGSMTDIMDNGETRWMWVEQAVESFIRKLNYVGDTKVSLVTFAIRSALACPFTNNVDELLDSLEIHGRNPYGLTNYNAPFLGNYPYVGEGFNTMREIRKRPPNIRRVFIFLTDGHPSQGYETRVDTILYELNTANVQMYSITLSQPMHNDLKRLSEGSGGKAFAVFTKEDLRNIYEYIALDIQRKQICELIWEAPFGCDEASRFRNVDITFKRQSISRRASYVAPPTSIATVETNGSIVSFGNPNVGVPVKQQIELSPQVSPFYVTNITTMPDTYFKIVNWGGDPPPFVVDTGETRIITVEFTQIGLKAYRQASLQFQGSPCSPLITLVGGTSQITVIHPNGSEVFSTCDVVDIKWGGVDPDQKVILWYSFDAGATWKLITNDATGLSYKWTPPQAGTNYLIRAAVAAQSLYLWANKYGGTGNEFGRSLAVTDDDLYYYVTGSFEESAVFGTENFTSKGGRDIFLTKFNSDGQVIWSRQAGGLHNDSATGVCVDPDGNAYITGTCMQSAQFGITVPTMDIINAPYCFVARYSANGTGVSVNVNLGPTAIHSGFKAWGLRIRYDAGKIYVEGRYTGRITIQSFSLPDRTNPTRFTAVFGTDLFLQDLILGGTAYPDYSTDSDKDSDGNIYATGSFEGNRSFSPSSSGQSIDLTSSGKSDVFVSKFGGTPGSEDISDKVFTVSSPVLSFTQNSVDMGSFIINQTTDKSFTGILCNTGTLSEEITKATITGAAAGDYSLISQLQGRVLHPGDCLPVEISFNPKKIGPRNAQLELESKCAKPITLSLNGNGVCSGDEVILVDYGKINVGVPKDSLITCALINTNNDAILMNPSIAGTHPGDFSIVSPIGSYLIPAGECVNITVRFTPQGANLREAILKYNLEAGCEDIETILQGFGVFQDIDIEDMDWKQRRVKSVNDTMLIVVNDMELPLELLDITSPKYPQFLITKPTMPQTIPANSSISIPLSFNPDAEMMYYDTLLFTFRDINDKMPAFLSGEGVIPQIDYYWICDVPVKPGETSVAVLVIENQSTSEDLFVNSIQLELGNTEFDWVGGVAPGNFYVPKSGGTRNFDINFTPSQAGLRDVDITIVHDAIEGPNRPFVKTDIITRTCEGLGVSFTTPIDFGGVMICDKRERTLRIDNKGGSTYLNITSFSISGTGASAFIIPQELNNLQIAPGSYRELTIGFNPDVVGVYDCILKLENSIGQDISIQLQGIGTYIDLYSTKLDHYETPGNKITVPVFAKIGELKEGALDEMNINIQYYSKMLLLLRDKDNVKGIEYKGFPGWQWSDTRESNDGKGSISVTGKGNFNVPFEGELFRLNFVMYLSNFVSTDVLAKPVLQNCETDDVVITTIHLSDFCFKSGRLVEVSSINKLSFDVNPNPVSDNFTIDYSVVLDAHTNIALYNSIGAKVLDIVDKELQSGIYTTFVNINNLPSGVYFIRVNSGPFTETKPLIINK